jgi:hypothetical protein
MSLINDALKRATQNPAPAATLPEPVMAMQPVDYQRRGLPWFFLPTLLIILAGACWFIIKGIQTTRNPSGALTVHAREPQPEPAPSADALSSAEMLTAGLVPVPAPSEFTPTRLPNRNFSLDDAFPAPGASEAPARTVTSVEPVKPAFRLQGIFFRTANPSATVNGKNVSIGSHVSGAIVKTITRDGVTLEADGQITVLTLE